MHAGQRTFRRSSLRVALAVVAAAFLLAACGTAGARHAASPKKHAAHSQKAKTSSTATAPTATPSSPKGPFAVQQLQMTGPDTGFALATLQADATVPSWPLGSYYPNALSSQVALLYTADGGARWSDVTPQDPFQSPGMMEIGTALDFLSPTTGWLAVEAQGSAGSVIAVSRTTNAGASWQTMTFMPAPPLQGSIRLDFTSPEDGWILSTSGPALGLMTKAIFATTDGGSTWQLVSCSLDPSCPLQPTGLPGDSYPTGFSFLGSAQGFLTAAYHGDPYVWFYGSEDAGRTWKRIALSVPPSEQADYGNAYPPAFFGSTGLMFVQYVGQESSLVLYRSLDGGQSWQPTSGQAIPSSAGPATISWATALDGWALSANDHFLWRTENGGTTFSKSPLPSAFTQYAETGPLPILDFSDPLHGMLVATVPSGTSLLFATKDGGETFTRLSPVLTAPTP